MKIVRELENNLSIEKIKEIYNRGNKLLAEFIDDEDISVQYLRELENFDIGKVKVKEGFFVESDCVLISGNSKIIIEEVVEVAYPLRSIAIVKPFIGEYSYLYLDYYLYNDNGIIATKLYEVKV